MTDIEPISGEFIFPFVIKCIFMFFAFIGVICAIIDANKKRTSSDSKSPSIQIEEKDQSSTPLLQDSSSNDIEEIKDTPKIEKIDIIHELGDQFILGIHSVAPLFMALGGVFASIPYLSIGIKYILRPVFALFGTDCSIAGTFIIAIDMGGYQLAYRLSNSIESLYSSSIMGYLGGPTIAFTLPVALNVLKPEHHKTFMLGLFPGLLSIPIGHIISCGLLAIIKPNVRSEISAVSGFDHKLMLNMGTVCLSLVPIVLFLLFLTIVFYIRVSFLLKGFDWFGRIFDALVKIVFMICIFEYFTQFFTRCGLNFGFDPLLADQVDQMRSLEVAGLICMMLAGAMPFAYCLRHFGKKQMIKFGKLIGLDDETGALGIIASLTNTLVMFNYFSKMTIKDRVLNSAFCVCAAFAIADHMAYCVIYQPTILGPLLIGKICGGIFAYILAKYLSVPAAYKLIPEHSSPVVEKNVSTEVETINKRKKKKNNKL